MRWLILIPFLVILIGCEEEVQQSAILGSWKVDSIQTYYNQFTSLIPGDIDHPTYEYLEGNKIREQKEGDFREFIYEWPAPDSMIFRSPAGETIASFQVLHLSGDRMVLKLKMNPIFEGKGQERFEIRHYSRIL